MITEIATMKTRPGLDDNAFVAVVDGLERKYHSLQPGFVDTELLRDEEGGGWIMVQHWESAEQMQAASAGMFRSDATLPFRQALEPGSVKLAGYRVAGRWEVAG